MNKYSTFSFEELIQLLISDNLLNEDKESIVKELEERGDIVLDRVEYLH